MQKIKKNAAVIAAIIFGINVATGQNLTAAQMNIYHGHPKSVTATGTQGTAITEFDEQGRIVEIRQGNMRISYDWEEDSKTITLSMYQGANLMNSSNIEISEFSNTRYEYRVDNSIDMCVVFKVNGAIDSVKMSTPQYTGTMVYFYRSDQALFPYAIEQSIGDQSVKASIVINETDEQGNPAIFTQEVYANKETTRYLIEYYR